MNELESQARAFERMRERFRARLPDRIAELDTAIDRAVDGDDPNDQREAYRLAHSLVGTVLTLGAPELAEPLREIEHVFLSPGSATHRRGALIRPRARLHRLLNRL